MHFKECIAQENGTFAYELTWAHFMECIAQETIHLTLNWLEPMITNRLQIMNPYLQHLRHELPHLYQITLLWDGIL